MFTLVLWSGGGSVTAEQASLSVCLSKRRDATPKKWRRASAVTLIKAPRIKFLQLTIVLHGTAKTTDHAMSSCSMFRWTCNIWTPWKGVALVPMRFIIVSLNSSNNSFSRATTLILLNYTLLYPRMMMMMLIGGGCWNEENGGHLGRSRAVPFPLRARVSKVDDKVTRIHRFQHSLNGLVISTYPLATTQLTCALITSKI